MKRDARKNIPQRHLNDAIEGLKSDLNERNIAVKEVAAQSVRNHSADYRRGQVMPCTNQPGRTCVKVVNERSNFDLLTIN